MINLDWPSNAHFLAQSMFQGTMPARNSDAHKGLFSSVANISGVTGMVGEHNYMHLFWVNWQSSPVFKEQLLNALKQAAVNHNALFARFCFTSVLFH